MSALEAATMPWRDTPNGIICNFQSVMRTCALALESVDDYSDDLRRRHTMDIRHVLEWFADGDFGAQAERYQALFDAMRGGADPRLSEMLSEHERLRSSINQHEGAAEDPNVVALGKQQVDNALAIIGYRPTSRADERRKAEFLRDWTDSTNLTEEEQSALLASLMPDGGAS